MFRRETKQNGRKGKEDIPKATQSIARMGGFF